MTTDNAFREWAGHDLVGQDGDKIGSIEDIYFDDETGQPDWATVKTGLFGHKVSFVPVTGMTSEGESLRSPWDKAKVKGAPNIDPDGHLSPEQERELYDYYGISYAYEGDDARRGMADADRGTAAVGRDTSGPSTDSAMTRSEEELQVGTRQREAGTARLRKWVETERETATVPVSHEEVRVEREAITDDNIDEAMSGPEISEEEHEVTLMEDEVVAGKQAVPKERVRLDKSVVTDEETVSDDVRKERIEVEGDARSETRRS